ncbi:MAG: hypothetical protein R6U78_02400, partial [Bacteroidales bacterium]
GAQQEAAMEDTQNHHDDRNIDIDQVGVKFNGEPTGRIWIEHQSVAGGGTLQLEMGPEPNKKIRGVE